MRSAPQHLRELADEYNVELLPQAREFFRARGIEFGYSRRRLSWFFSAIGLPDGPTTAIIWCGVADFAEYLDAPSTLLHNLRSIGGNVTI